MKVKLPSCPARLESGVAVIVMLALLALILMYVAANLRTLYNLERELKLTEQRQVRRLAALSATNAPPPVRGVATNPPPALLQTPPPAAPAILILTSVRTDERGRAREAGVGTEATVTEPSLVVTQL